jgi:hypothetical protein
MQCPRQDCHLRVEYYGYGHDLDGVCSINSRGNKVSHQPQLVGIMMSGIEFRFLAAANPNMAPL